MTNDNKTKGLKALVKESEAYLDKAENVLDKIREAKRLSDVDKKLGKK